MHNELKALRKELPYLAAIFLALALVLKIAYYREGFVEVAKTAFSVYWLFVLPGYAMTFYWRASMHFLERVVVGTIAAMGLIGIISYYLGLMGLKIGGQVFILPLLVAAASFAACLKFSAAGTQAQPEAEGQAQQKP